MTFPRIVETVDPPGPLTQAMLNERREARLRLQAQLVADVAEGIRVLVTRDKVKLTEAQILDRARNIVTGLQGNYLIEERPC